VRDGRQDDGVVDGAGDGDDDSQDAQIRVPWVLRRAVAALRLPGAERQRPRIHRPRQLLQPSRRRGVRQRRRNVSHPFLAIDGLRPAPSALTVYRPTWRRRRRRRSRQRHAAARTAAHGAHGSGARLRCVRQCMRPRKRAFAARRARGQRARQSHVPGAPLPAGAPPRALDAVRASTHLEWRRWFGGGRGRGPGAGQSAPQARRRPAACRGHCAVAGMRRMLDKKRRRGRVCLRGATAALPSVGICSSAAVWSAAAAAATPAAPGRGAAISDRSNSTSDRISPTASSPRGR
jgi:hypothetical protein